MASQRVFETESIDLAAYLVTAGYVVATTLNPGDHRATFQIEETPNLYCDIVGYESGMTAPAKRLLNVRSRLFREASAVVRSGGGR